MATRSTIAMEYPDKTVKQIYCHWDGYLENNGIILRDDYTDPDKVNELIMLGNISSLDSELNECEAYHRDRNEDYEEPSSFENVQNYLDNAQMEEYNYLYRNGVWYVISYATDDQLVSIDEAFEMVKDYA